MCLVFACIDHILFTSNANQFLKSIRIFYQSLNTEFTNSRKFDKKMNPCAVILFINGLHANLKYILTWQLW